MLKDINEVIAGLKAECEEEIVRSARNARVRCEENIKNVESTRLGLALFASAGMDLGLCEWMSGRQYTLNLGYFAHTKIGSRSLAEKVRQIRNALGCAVKPESKEVADGKKMHVNFILRPVDFPTITVKYERRLPKGAKCRIKTQRSTYRSLVCEGI